MTHVDQKYDYLTTQLSQMDSILVAFSGGVDSTFLSVVASRTVGPENTLAVTALSPLYPQREQAESEDLAKRLGLRHLTLSSNELDIPGFRDNPPERCYYCKQELFSTLWDVAESYGIEVVADGTNADDASDYRPGRKAGEEAGVRSPLMEAGLTKQEIRELSSQMELPTANKPALACLASRIPYGTEITESKLQAVDSVESYLREKNLAQCRVRHHGDIARIEVEAAELPALCSDPLRSEVLEVAQNAGFDYVTVDLEGYRTGSMNKKLEKNETN